MRDCWPVTFKAALAFALLVGVVPIAADDGVVLINQSKAVAGSVTPGDLPGFPVTITRRGSFKLSGNLTVTDPNVDVINIKADHVTLNLNGFTIQGPMDLCANKVVPTWCYDRTAGTGVRALYSPGAYATDVAVLNGSVRALDFGVVLVYGSRAERLSVQNNRSGGLTVDGGCIVSGNIVSRNGGHGLAAYGCIVTGNHISFNEGYGLEITDSTVWSNNIVDGNNSNGDQVRGRGVDGGGNYCYPGGC